MAAINSVTGKLDLADLGRTLIHEHVLVGFPGWYLDPRRPPFVRAEAMARAVDAFQQLHAWGVRSVVDPCPSDLGRDVEFNAEVSQRSRINLICSTGLYTEAMGAGYMIKALPVEEITEIYVHEIEQGIGRSGIRAGVIKIATGEGQVTAYERRLLTAAARASKITGVPVLSHTENCTCGHDQIDIVTGEGVAPDQLLIGHSDGRDDPDYQRSLANRGVFVGFDRFGMEMIVPDEVRMRNIKIMVDAGRRDQILVSHDSVECLLGGLPGKLPLNSLRDVAPNARMTHLFENIFPQLLEMGLSQVDLDAIVIDNPLRFFAGPSHRHQGAA